MCRFLISRGARVNARDFAGMTPLHWSVEQKSQATIDALLENGADVTITDKEGRTPIASLPNPNLQGDRRKISAQKV
jgi:ankyrin repeat protein